MLSGFTPTTSIEYHYKEFYELYLATLDPAAVVEDHLLDLLALAQKCPFKDGPVVYNARVLYNLLSGSVIHYNDNGCELISGERKNLYSNSYKEAKNSDTYQIHPNPAVNELFIFGKHEKEKINLVVKDLSNRILIQEKLYIENYIGKLQFSLPSGVYFVTLINKDEGQITKKLVISK